MDAVGLIFNFDFTGLEISDYDKRRNSQYIMAGSAEAEPNPKNQRFRCFGCQLPCLIRPSIQG